MSSRPPPPPPTIGAASRTTVRRGEPALDGALGDEDDEADLAVAAAAEDDRGVAAELRLHPVGQLEQLLLVGERRRAATTPDPADLGRLGDEALRLLAEQLLLRLLGPLARLAQSLGRSPGAGRAGPAASRAARPPRAARSSRSRNQSIAAGPVSASIRRTLAALEPSETILKIPTSAVLATWVPPQSSRETPSTSTTRTHSPYFSPKSAIAPSRSASVALHLQPAHRPARLDPLVDAVLDRPQLLGARAPGRG